MKLYYKPGACSMAAHIILHEVGASFAAEKVDTSAGLTESGQSFAAINPRGYVPALGLADGSVITENAAILQFLADQFPLHNLAPAGGVERVRLQESLSFLSCELHKAFGPFFLGRQLAPPDRQAALKVLHRQVGHVDAMLSDGRPYLLGDAFTVADAYAFVILNWTNFIDVSLDAWPNAMAFQSRVGSRAAVQSALRAEGIAA